MLWRLAVSYPDYFLQLSTLLYAPIYHGANVPKGKGEPVLLIPGFLAGDWTLAVMAGWLNRLGYRAYLSGLDWNVDCPNKTGELLQWRLDYLTQKTSTPLTVVGHSLGGMLARFLGANFPENIHHVIAIGAPLDGSMRVHPLFPFAFRTLQVLRGTTEGAAPACARSVRCTCPFTRALSSPLPEGVGLTTIFSKQDELVDWRACLDPQGENQEVSGRHFGLIVNREVYRVLANTLARASNGHGEPHGQGRDRSAEPNRANPSSRTPLSR